MAVAVGRWSGPLHLTPLHVVPRRPAAGVLGSEKLVSRAVNAACVWRPFERDKSWMTVGSMHGARRAYSKVPQGQPMKEVFSSGRCFDLASHSERVSAPAQVTRLSGDLRSGAPGTLHGKRTRFSTFSTTSPNGDRTLYRTQRTEKSDRIRKGSFRRTGHTVAAATNNARTFPKVQTGVTLKWVSPKRTSVERGKHITEMVLESICPDASADEQKVEFTVKTVAWRKRHISASVEVEAGLEKVWQVLTDYERLADFIPNLAKSERIPCPTRGRIWLLQLGVQSSMYWQIEARVVLDLEERFGAPGGPELHFSMVEGDFKLFAGKWAIRNSDRLGHVTLHYEVDVLPRAILPTAFVERIIQADLPRNLRAIANRAQTLMTSPSDADVAPPGSPVSSANPVLVAQQHLRTGPDSGDVVPPSSDGLMTSSSDGAMTSSSDPLLTSHPSTALPPSLVTVATGAGAGLNLEVSWWSGPGQPPNPGLISPPGGAVKCNPGLVSPPGGAVIPNPGSISQTDEAIKFNPGLLEHSDGAGKVTENGQGIEEIAGGAMGNSLPIGEAETKTVSDGVNQQTPGVIVTENGLLVEGVAGFGDGSGGPKAEHGTAAVLEPVVRPALPSLERGPDSKLAPLVGGRERGSELEAEKSGRKMHPEPVVELVDAPYFPAECPVISSDDQAVRATLRHRVDEVHLRRMDDLLEKGGVHRRVVAAITIAATAEVVWDVLTDYEGLQDFIPNLVKSKVLSRHPEEHRVRLHQIGVKCLCYMVLHAQATMDVTELPHREILFSQVSGDFDSFEGRWFLEPLGPGHTLLKYAVETRVLRNSLLPESLVEEVIYEDLPANLCAIRKRVESNKSIYSDPSFRPQENCPPETRPSQRGGRSWGSHTPRSDIAHVSETTPRKKMLRKVPITPCAIFLEAEPAALPAVKTKPKRVRTNRAVTETVPRNKTSKPAGTAQTLGKPRKAPPKPRPDYRDFGALEAALSEFVAAHGVSGFMPTRAQLRGAKRVDLERGMRLHGGPSSVAEKLGLVIQHQQKPARYWCDLGNMEKEIKVFQPTIGLAADGMPSRRTLEKADKPLV